MTANPNPHRPPRPAPADSHSDWQPACPGTADVGGARVDLDRDRRCGFGEVVYGEGKSADLIVRIVEAKLDADQPSLITRIDADVAAAVMPRFDHVRYSDKANTLRIAATPIEPPTGPRGDQPHVAVVTAGSTDAGVAAEAVETLGWMNLPVITFDDIGVAGPQRLAAAVPALRRATALVVIAGMEGALPSVIGGHVAAPIFAVPTSVGYGANLGGVTALLSMLTSCAAGVAVVNIDAGFKGAYLAGMVLRAIVNGRAAVGPNEP